jgi:hypothetical protein
MKQIVWQAATITLLVGLSTSSSAFAQQSDPQSIAAAQSLVDEASDLMDAGKFEAACPKLEQATKLVPSGVGARLALAECYVGQGKLASAQGQYLQAEALANAAKDPKRAKEAGQEAAKLKSKIATITLVVPAEVRKIEGISLTWDDMVWEPATWGAPIPVDVGKHLLVVKAPGYKPWKFDVNVETNGRAMEQAVPMLEKLPLEVVKPPIEKKARGKPVETKSARTALLWTGVGLTLVGVGAGSSFTVAASANHNDALALAKQISLYRGANETLCPTATTDANCTKLFDLENRRDAFASVGIVSFVVGGVAGVTTVVYALATRDKPKTKTANSFVVLPYWGGVSAAGAF